MGLEHGTFISHYKILSTIGRGGMGEVFLAEDTRLRRQVAIKFLPAEISVDPVRLRRFEREAYAASALNHPNIMTIHEFGETEGMSYLVSEYVKGKTLREVIDEGEILPLEAVRITIQIASALQSAHAAGILHRDIKPENIVLRDDGYIKVLDFGLAKHIENKTADNFDSNIPTQIQTQANMVLGTAAYMSPEQARGRLLDARSDLFSLGVVLYELLTFRQPFVGETINHTIVAVLEHEPKSVSIVEPRLPRELDSIVRRALEKDRDKRFKNAKEMLTALKAVKRQIDTDALSERISQPEKTPSITSPFSEASTTGQIETGSTIAVLPFVNIGGNKDGDYFSDGLAEELLNVLSKIRGVRVAARTSAFSFKGKQTTVAEIGRALNVASVLEGSVRTAAKRVRISVQLIKVSDGYQLWSETYDRTMDDIFAVQDDIASCVVEELRAMLIGEDAQGPPSRAVIKEVAEAVKGRATSPEAQRLMLLGRHFLDRTTPQDTARAIAYFQEALEIDAGYALCWAELARAFSIEAGRGWAAVDEGFNRSRDAALRALALEPELAEAHAQLGRIQAAHDWDLKNAEISYRKALELAPGSSSVMDGAGLLAYKMGRFDEALRLSRKVLTQDPLSAAFWHNLGLTCHAAGRLAESEKSFRRALELVPQRFVTRALMALVMMDSGQTIAARAAALSEPDEFWRTWAQAILEAVAGNNKKSDEFVKILLDKFTAGNAYQLAEVFAMRGEIDTAFEWLERAFLERDSGMTHTKVNPRFQPLHKDSRWRQMLEKIGFDV